MMTLAERDALEALRRRLHHAEGICHCVTLVSTGEHLECVRGVGMLLEDGIKSFVITREVACVKGKRA